MDDTCDVSRPGAESLEDIDPITLRRIEAAATTIYSGRCSVGSASRPGSPIVNVGGDQQGLTGYSLSLPLYLAPELRAGDLVRVTSSRRDPDLTGRVFKIDEVLYKTFAISRKAQMTLEA